MWQIDFFYPSRVRCFPSKWRPHHRCHQVVHLAHGLEARRFVQPSGTSVAHCIAKPDDGLCWIIVRGQRQGTLEQGVDCATRADSPLWHHLMIRLTKRTIFNPGYIIKWVQLTTKITVRCQAQSCWLLLLVAVCCSNKSNK